MTMLSFKQVEFNYGKKAACKRSCNQIIKFSHCFNFAYFKYGIVVFINSDSKWLYTLHAQGCCEPAKRGVQVAKTLWRFYNDRSSIK